VLSGIALRDVDVASQAGVGTLRAAVENDPFDEWLAEPLDVLLLD
jgi:hypothetical protein